MWLKPDVGSSCRPSESGFRKRENTGRPALSESAYYHWQIDRCLPTLAVTFQIVAASCTSSIIYICIKGRKCVWYVTNTCLIHFIHFSIFFFWYSSSGPIVDQLSLIHIAFLICVRLPFLRKEDIPHCKISARSRAKSSEFRHWRCAPLSCHPLSSSVTTPTIQRKKRIWHLGELIPPAFAFVRWWYKPT
jgi:hypothetical protein